MNKREAEGRTRSSQNRENGEDDEHCHLADDARMTLRSLVYALQSSLSTIHRIVKNDLGLFTHSRSLDSIHSMCVDS